MMISVVCAVQSGKGGHNIPEVRGMWREVIENMPPIVQLSVYANCKSEAAVTDGKGHLDVGK